MDGHDRRFVPAEADLLEGRAHERRARSDHDLEELSSRVVVDDREVGLRRGAQPRDPLEVDDPVHVPGEHEARAATKHAVRRDGRHGARLVVELDEIDALEVRRPACAMVRPTRALPAVTTISTVKARAATSSLEAWRDGTRRGRPGPGAQHPRSRSGGPRV